MRRALRPFAIVLLTLVVALILVGTSRLSQPKELIPWRTKLADAKAEARRANKPLFLDFTADWCAPCRGLKRTLWSDPGVESELQRFVPVQLDVDREGALASELGVEFIPAFFVIEPGGRVLRRQSGVLSRTEFLSWITPAVVSPAK